jgi:endonuclease YncB( thermonuclease family)
MTPNEQLNQISNARNTPTPGRCWRRVACGLALLTGSLTSGAATVAVIQEVRVARVVDGDTLLVTDAQSLYSKVRLHGIDAPECSMPFGPQAQQFLVKLTQGKIVQMATKGRDRYGRTVATLALNGQDVGWTIVRSGFAWRDGRYDRPRFAGQTTPYTDAQREAQVETLGLWSNPAPSAPWVWRMDGRQSPKRNRCVGSVTRGSAP